MGTQSGKKQRRIAVLGAGRMGATLVGAYLDAGHPVTVWNRTASKCAPLAARGARVASSIADAVRGGDLIITNLSDYAATRSVLHGDEEATRALRGKVLVELASGTPAEARAHGAWAESHGVEYLDGAIMATPEFIAKPGCTLLYSGPEPLFGREHAVLAVMGDNGLYVGAPIGHANALDNALLVVLWGALFGALHGAAVCDVEGFPLAEFAPALEAIMPVMSETLKGVLDRIGRRHYVADATTPSTVATCHASVRHLLAIARPGGIDATFLEALDAFFVRATRAGDADADIAAVYQVMRTR